PPSQPIAQRRFAGTAVSGESDDARCARISGFLLGRWALGVERLPRRSVARAGWAFAFRIGVFDFTEFVRELLIERFGARSLCSRFAIALMNKAHHLFERCAGKKNFVYAFALHDDRIIMRDRSAAAAEHFDVVRAFFAQQTDNFSERFDVPAVVPRHTDRASVLLHCGSHT